jgi:hypothetical protein
MNNLVSLNVQTFTNKADGQKYEEIVMSDVVEFGFDEAKVIKSQAVEQFKQSKNGEKHRVSIVSFKKHHDVVLGKKAAEKGSPLTDQEKAEYIARIDTKLAEGLKKSIEQLTEVDRLDIKQPRFSYAFTHYREDVGTIRCLSKYNGNTLVEKGPCCDAIGDAEQTVGTVIMTYPVDEHLQVEEEILKAKKMTNFYIWKLGSKKFKKLEGTYVDTRNAGMPVVDLKVTLDGEAKFQKQVIEAMQGAAFWAREGADPAVRQWILEQGLRLYKYVQNNLGFEMKRETFLEKTGKSPSLAAGSEAAAAALPKAVGSYDDLLT